MEQSVSVQQNNEKEVAAPTDKEKKHQSERLINKLSQHICGIVSPIQSRTWKVLKKSSFAASKRKTKWRKKSSSAYTGQSFITKRTSKRAPNGLLTLGWAKKLHTNLRNHVLFPANVVVRS